MIFKAKVTKQYGNSSEGITLELDKETPVRWFGGEVLIGGKKLNVNIKERLFANEVNTSESGEYIGKELIIPKSFKRFY